MHIQAREANIGGPDGHVEGLAHNGRAGVFAALLLEQACVAKIGMKPCQNVKARQVPPCAEHCNQQTLRLELVPSSILI